MAKNNLNDFDAAYQALSQAREKLEIMEIEITNQRSIVSRLDRECHRAFQAHFTNRTAP